jgi:hypothetical protein
MLRIGDAKLFVNNEGGYYCVTPRVKLPPPPPASVTLLGTRASGIIADTSVVDAIVRAFNLYRFREQEEIRVMVRLRRV